MLRKVIRELEINSRSTVAVATQPVAGMSFLMGFCMVLACFWLCDDGVGERLCERYQKARRDEPEE